MSKAGLEATDRKVVAAARGVEEATGNAATAIELEDGTLITGKTGSLLGPSAGCIINAIKHLAGIPQEEDIISPEAIAPIQELKINYLGSRNPRLHPDEVLIALSTNAFISPTAALAMKQLKKLRGCQVHTTAALSAIDRRTLKRLGMVLTYEPKGI